MDGGRLLDDEMDDGAFGDDFTYELEDMGQSTLLLYSGGIILVYPNYAQTTPLRDKETSQKQKNGHSAVKKDLELQDALITPTYKFMEYLWYACCIGRDDIESWYS
ncbi:hypothetical protein Fot_14270 [Forsythia ovata]|uniref:Uncharacterized protein n=1 Tax=Forsythia ovata TaxID=205694 RepID=A0ABD1W5W0_9LAMI